MVPKEAEQAFLILKKQLAEHLVAVYLHGSAVAGGLRPRSDVDLLVVINQPMSALLRQRLVSDLMKISGRYPYDSQGRRPLEVIIFLSADLSASLYPAQCEFIYGEWLRDQYESGEISKPVCDPDMTLVLAQARQAAISLVGPDASSLLPHVSKLDIHQAIKGALPALMKSLYGDERNVLLTLARMWRTLVTGEFVPKDVAAEWAAAHLSSEEAAVLKNARDAYLGIGEEDWRNRRQELQLTVSALRDRVLENL